MAEVVATTMRRGIEVEELRVTLGSGEVVRGLCLGRRDLPTSGAGALVVHHERGDWSTMFDELEALYARSVVAMSFDMPEVRTAWAARDQLGAFEVGRSLVTDCLAALAAHPSVEPHRLGLVGRGLGGEIACRVAADTAGCRAVAVWDVLPERSRHLSDGTHPLAAGAHLHLEPDDLQRQVDGLANHDVVQAIAAGPLALWLVQASNDDDRLDEPARHALTMGLPSAVKLDWADTSAVLRGPRAVRDRASFIERAC